MGIGKSETGSLGEGIACRFLESKGFSIREKNYRKKWGEIDIIAEKENFLRFVEVKAVRALSHESMLPEENVHPKKLKRLFRTIETYLLEKGRNGEEWQLDVVAVFIDFSSKTAWVRLTENVVAE